MRLVSSALLVSIITICASCNANRDPAVVREAAAGAPQAARDAAPATLASLREGALWTRTSGREPLSDCALVAQEDALWMNLVPGGAQVSRLEVAASLRGDGARWQVAALAGGCLAAHADRELARVLDVSGHELARVEVAPLRAALEAAAQPRKLYRDMVRQHDAVAVLWPSARGQGAHEVFGLAAHDALAAALGEAPLDSDGVGVVVGWPSARPGAAVRPLWLVIAVAGRRLAVAL